MEKEGIEVEIVYVGDKLIWGCFVCGMCVKNKNERCVIDDEVNEWIGFMKNVDGIILGFFVYYLLILVIMKVFLDRVFYVFGVNGNLLCYKVGVVLVVVRCFGGI